MPRVVKEYDERYREFLGVAERLFYAQGYEQTSVQSIIDMVGVAKGTFYHYFASKVELLDALVARSMAEVIGSLQPLLDDPAPDAVAKLEQLFIRLGSWKAENRAFLLEAMQVLYEDKNVLLRTKMQAEVIALATPLLARIIQQGTEEGHFTVAHAEETAEIILAMSQAFSESTARLLLAEERGESVRATLQRKVTAYERSIERVLAATTGSMTLFNLDDIFIWFE